jgi:hypothetical protein
MIVNAIVLALGLSAVGSAEISPAAVTHVSNTFRFEVAEPFSRVVSLFGGESERGWAGKEWDPVFFYPQPAKDVQGAVFQTQHGALKTTWVNTVFDLAHGRMQYVAFVPDLLATTVDVQVTAIDASHTAVEVTYARTALATAANDHVRELGARDRESGPEWKRDLEKYLGIEEKAKATL